MLCAFSLGADYDYDCDCDCEYEYDNDYNYDIRAVFSTYFQQGGLAR